MAWSKQRFAIRNLETGAVWRSRRLALMPEPDWLACLSDAEPGDDPVESYTRYLVGLKEWPEVKAQGWVPIYWSVAMEGNGTWLAPYLNPEFGFVTETWYDQGFDRPIDEKTGRPVNWFSLPIEHRFPAFWEAIGFQPAPFQERFDLRILLDRG